MRLSTSIAVILMVVAGPEGAHAQSVADCGTPRRPGIGVAVGRSSPYFEPSLRDGGSGTTGTTGSRGGLMIAGRADLPIEGAWRGRVQGGAARWHLERQVYSADLRRVIATETTGRIQVREIVGLVGRQVGRPPVCAYVLAGGGFYSLRHEGASHRNSGFALAAGIEIPAGPHGAVQVDVQLHLITTRERYPIASSAVLDGRLSAGWLYRF
jgi:hypothetical protein